MPIPKLIYHDDVRNSYYPTKTIITIHKRALHKHIRGDQIDDIKLEEYDITEAFELQGATMIVNQRNDEHLVVFNDNHCRMDSRI